MEGFKILKVWNPLLTFKMMKNQKKNHMKSQRKFSRRYFSKI
jgi:hypothetical protein